MKTIIIDCRKFKVGAAVLYAFLHAVLFAVLFAALQILAGCSSDQYVFSHRDLRGDRYSKVDNGAVSPGLARKGKEKTDLAQCSIYVSAVSFPEGYDWRKDTLGGPEGCRIVLYKASEPDADSSRALVFEEILSLPAGAGSLFSADQDMHHLIEGHLITEASTENETVIFKDGEELIRFPGREYLRGFYEMPDGGPVYTLTQNRDGPGFHFRCGLEVIATQANGMAFGGFSDTNFDRHGGLNLNRKGVLEFAYRMSGRKYYYTDFGKTPDGWMPDRGITVKYIDDLVTIEDLNNYRFYMFYYRQDGTFEYYNSSRQRSIEFPPGNWYLFLTEGVSLLDEDVLLALTPISRDAGHPAVWTGNNLIPVPVNGFLTGIEVVGEGP